MTNLALVVLSVMVTTNTGSVYTPQGKAEQPVSITAEYSLGIEGTDIELFAVRKTYPAITAADSTDSNRAIDGIKATMRARARAIDLPIEAAGAGGAAGGAAAVVAAAAGAVRRRMRNRALVA